jgi:hypothetical protein
MYQYEYDFPVECKIGSTLVVSTQFLEKIIDSEQAESRSTSNKGNLDSGTYEDDELDLRFAGAIE